MQFSNFDTSTSGLTISLFNINPIEYVERLKFYTENSAGSFDKKEFRWSFNNNHWSSWETLNQGNLSSVSTEDQKFLYFDFRFVQDSSGSGTATSITINYDRLSDAEITELYTTIHVSPVLEVIETTPVSEYPNTSVTKSNADLFDFHYPAYYLSRSNHTGSQSVSTIQGLNKILNNLINGKIENGVNEDLPGIGTFSRRENVDLYFKTLFSYGSITITEPIEGQLCLDVSASFGDASLAELYEWNTIQDVSIISLYDYNSIQDASILALESSANWAAGLDGQIQFNDNGYFGADSSFYWDSSLGRLGIGTSTPLANLHIEDPFNPSIILYDNAGFGQLILQATNAHVTIVNTYSQGTMFIGANKGLGLAGSSASNTDLYIDSSGNVGIGTTTPLAKLHINGSTGSIEGGLAFGDGDTGLYEAIDDRLTIAVNGLAIWRIGSSYLEGESATGPAIFRTGISGTIPGFIPIRGDYDTGIGSAGDDILSLIAGGVNGLNVNGSGFVGIGTTNPSVELDVNGDSDATAYLGKVALGGLGNDIAYFAHIDLFDVTNYAFRQDFVGNSTLNGQTLNFRISNGVNAMTITSSKDVGIGTTTPTEVLDVSGFINTNQDYLLNGVSYLQDVSARVYAIESDVVDIYDISTGVKNLLEDSSNWNAGDPDFDYDGSTITGTFQGQQHYDADYFFVAVDTNDWIRLMRG